MNYKQYLQSDDWKHKRFKKLGKVNKCEACNSKNCLHVHHLEYRNLYDVKQSDLMVLCEECHDYIHALLKRGDIDYKKMDVSIRAEETISILNREPVRKKKRTKRWRKKKRRSEPTLAEIAKL